MTELTITLGIGVYIASLLLYNILDISWVKKWFVDYPDDDRKLHEDPKPRHGGLVFAGISLAMISFHPVFESVRWIGIGGWVLFVLGILDDIFQLSYKIKSVAQLSIAVFLGVTQLPLVDVNALFAWPVPHYLTFGLFVIWFMGISNAINLIDGMDGLAGGVSALVLVTLYFLGLQTGNEMANILIAVILSSLLVFLMHNSKPARLFMGDTGSLFLGYILAILPFLYVKIENQIKVLDLAPFLIMYAYIIVDTFRVMWIRFGEKRNPLSPDQEHFHHLLIESTGSYNGTLFLIFLFVSLPSIIVLKLKSIENITFFGLIVLLLSLTMIFSSQFKKCVIQLCTKLVVTIRKITQNASFRIKKRSARWVAGVLLLNIISFVVAVIEQWPVIQSPNNWGYSIAALLVYVILFRKHERASFVLITIPLIMVAMILVQTQNNIIDYTLLGINTVSIIWVAFAHFQKLLLRYWTVYDMLILFIGFILISTLSTLMQIITMAYLMTCYILLKIVVTQIERKVLEK